MKWEQKIEVIETGSVITRGKVNIKEVNQLLEEYGSQGFELVTAIPIGDGAVGTRRIALFFKRAKTG